MKIFLITFISLLLISCSDDKRDKLTTIVIKNEIDHLKKYKQIRRTTDLKTQQYLDSTFIVFKDGANVALGMLQNENSYFTPLDSSIFYVKVYIDSLKN